MSKQPGISIFIFRRDLRIRDNTAFIECFKEKDIIIPIFIFSPSQVTNNEYKSNRSVQFMIESLESLEKELSRNNNSNKQPILYFYGQELSIIQSIHKKIVFDNIYINKDYTPFSKHRDETIKSFCDKNKINFYSFHDVCLYVPGSILTGNGEIYKKYTPFYNNCVKNKNLIPSASKVISNNKSFISNTKLYDKCLNLKNLISLKEAYLKLTIPTATNRFFGGIEEANKKLSLINEFSNYQDERNDLTKETTQLSPYIKYGCLSIRDVYEKILSSLKNKSEDIIKQLIWRDFYIHLMNEYPETLNGWNSKSGNKSLKPKYDNIKWGNNKKWFNSWCNGETGYPIVDACMKELNNTGYMHNRGRLIVSSFLIKILQIDWRWGEKYFATKLIDYDPAVNNGNWQWASGSGADSQPYFRIFNPELQSYKHDKNAEYIKKWMPNLKNIEAKHLHEWQKYYKEYDLDDILYFKPIVEYSKMKENTLKLYKKYL